MSAHAVRPYDTEAAQALVRMVIAPLVTGYMLWTYAAATLDASWLLYLAAQFCVVSLLLLNDVIRHPGVRPRRRLLTMLHDYVGITLTLAYGGEAMLPVYGLLIWLTVGYGLRYGVQYLLLATAMSTLSLLTVAALSAYWQAHPYLLVTLLFTSLMVPAYMHALLRARQQASEAEHAAVQAKARFLAQASHDLRQPIHAIGLFTAGLRDGRLDAEQQGLVDNIDKSLHSVSGLFRSILDLYSLDGERTQVRAEVVCLPALLQQLIRQNAEAARWAGVDIRLHCRDLHVHADPALLLTVLQNLLSNALKYAGGQPLLIGCRARNGQISVEIYDQGSGIAAEHLGLIFEEFYRVRQARDRDIEGVGLGLAIVKRLAALMHVQIRIRSVESRGTLVAIDGLQRAVAASRRTAAAEREHTFVRLLEGLRVCLIEDDCSVLQATATLLRRWGCEVHTGSTAAAIPPDFDLLITDFDLGTAFSGADCITYARSQVGRDIPAIVVTGHEVSRVQEALTDERIAVLAKPVRPAELRSLLLAHKLEQAL